MVVEGPTTASEDAIQADARRFRVVAIVAAVIALPFVLLHATVALTVVPSLASFSSDMGGSMPPALQLAFALSHNGILALMMLAIDVGVFVFMYWLAKRYWIGLLFAPVLAYLAISALLIPVLYLPLFSTITQIK